MFDDASSHRSTSVPPDCDEIDRVIKAYCADRPRVTEDSIYRDAGFSSGRRMLKLWQDGGWTRLNRLQYLADRVDVPVEQFIHNGPQVPDITHPEDPCHQFRDLVMEALHSDVYLEEAHRLGGIQSVPIAKFLWKHYRDRLYHIPLTAPQQDGQYDVLSRMGLLERWKAKEEETGWFPIFRYRVFTERQCKIAFKARVREEKVAIRHALRLRDSRRKHDHEEYDLILRQQLATQSKMKALHLLLPNEEKAEQLVSEDARMHQGWPGNDPTLTQLLQVAMASHHQAVCRLIVAQKCLRNRGKQPPDGLPTLSELVQDFYPETKQILDAFLAVSRSRSRENSLRELMVLVETHPQHGYQYVLQALEWSRVAFSVD
ncbi:MAG: hypothetical protein KDA86_15995 [Planctomycetaceae bacterium]|nr:hypothetical protein [Planctomycetaceae bacterium]